MENKSILVEIDEQSKIILDGINDEINSSINKINTALQNLFDDYKKNLDLKITDVDSKLNDINVFQKKLENTNVEVIKSIKDTQTTLDTSFKDYNDKLELVTSKIQSKLDDFDKVFEDTKKLLAEVNQEYKKASEENGKIREDLSQVKKELKYSNLPFYKKLLKRKA